jgi:hypothetical protein
MKTEKEIRDKLRLFGWRLQKADFPKGRNARGYGYRWYAYKSGTGRYFKTLSEVSEFAGNLTKIE